MNSVNVIGRLAQDVELRYTPNGKAVANARIAVDGAGPFINEKEGNEAGFFKIVQWGDSAAVNFAEYCRKGRKIGVSGKLSSRTFEREDGTRAYVVEIVASHIDYLEEPKGESNDAPENPVQNAPSRQTRTSRTSRTQRNK